MEIIFDFDGTIADTFETGVDIVNRLANKYRYPEIGLDEILTFRKYGFREALRLMRTKGMSWISLLRIGRRVQKELNKEIGNIKMFKGVGEVIDQLKKEGYILGILSTNTQKNISDFLRINKLDKLFDYVETCGFVWGKTKRFKKILKRRGLSSEDVIYIGDEIRDIVMCQKLRVKIVVVTWGYSAKTKLAEHDPEWLISQPRDILKAVDNARRQSYGLIN